MKKNLIVLCGQDRSGKDYLLDHLSYIDHLRKITEEFKALHKVPDYVKDKDNFQEYLKEYFTGLTSYLNDEVKDSIIVRLFTSEYVYSQLFNRANHLELLNPILENYDLTQIILLHYDYNSYLEKCIDSNSEIEYNELDFLKTQELYLNSPFNKISKNNIIIYLKGNEFVNLRQMERIINAI